LLTAPLLFVSMLAALAIGAERDALIAMRDKNEISDDVLREIQHDLDLEQVLLEQPGPSDGGFDSAPEIRRDTRG
jgi:hypothetical protein